MKYTYLFSTSKTGRFLILLAVILLPSMLIVQITQALPDTTKSFQTLQGQTVIPETSLPLDVRNTVPPIADSPIWTSSDSPLLSDAAWGDLNLDGTLDLVVAGQTTIYLNDGFNEQDQLSLEPHNLLVGDWIDAVALGDMDQDGDLDIVVNQRYSGTLIYVNQQVELGQFSLKSPQLIGNPQTTPSDTGYGLHLGDMDGDGDLDIATGWANRADGWNSLTPLTDYVYRNDGIDMTGALIMSMTWNSPAEFTQHSTSVAWGNGDRDFDLDLLITSKEGYAHLYENISGTLSATPVLTLTNDPSTQIPDFGSNMTHAAWADIDADGDAEIVITTGSDGTPPVRVYGLDKNNGVWSKTNVWHLDSGVDSEANGGMWGDIDNDGDLDLILSGTIDRPVRIYLNTGTTLASEPIWESDSIGFSVGRFVDIDNDGRLDVSIHRDGAGSTIYLNQGATLSSKHTILLDNTFESAMDIAWGDMNNDGKLELAVANSASVESYENHGFNFRKGIPERNWIYRLDAGPLLFNDENTLIADPDLWTQNYETAQRSTAVAWGDVNGDGYLDLAVGNSPIWTSSDPNDIEPNSAFNEIYINNAGSLPPTPTYTFGNGNDYTIALAWGDYDGDGDLDLAEANWGTEANTPQEVGGQNYIYENIDGQLSPTPVWVSDYAGRTTDVAWGDINNDGSLDLLFGETDIYIGDSVGVYQNNSGQIELADIIWIDKFYSFDLGDVNGDGLLDLAVGLDGLPDRLHLNENGFIQDTAAWSGDSGPNSKVALGDINGDGLLDLVSGGATAGIAPTTNKIYINQQGTLSTNPWESELDQATLDVAIGDADGDGRKDVAFANHRLFSLSTDQNGILLYLNRGLRVPQQPLQTEEIIIHPDSDPVQTFSSTVTTLSAANYYALPAIRNANTLPINFSLSHPNNMTYREIQGWYSINGGGQWLPAIISGTQTNVLTAPITADSSTADLMAYWQLNEGEGDTLLDSSGNQNHMQRLSGVWGMGSEDVPFVTPYDLNGSFKVVPDSITNTANDTWNYGTADYSISMWVDPIGYSNGSIISQWNADQLFYQFRLQFYLDGLGWAIQVYQSADGVNSETMAAQSFNFTGYHHIAIVRKGPQLHLYINGELSATTTAISMPDAQVIPLTFGAYNSAVIDDVRLYNRALNTAELTALADGKNNPLTTHTYHWSVADSNFFGKSDNTIFRIDAFPAYTPTVNSTAHSHAKAKISTQTYPFRLGGTQVQVDYQGEPVSGAVVYQIPAGSPPPAYILGDGSGLPLSTDQGGYLNGRPIIQQGDQLLAMWPIPTDILKASDTYSIPFANNYTLYLTSGAPTNTGVEFNQAESAGVVSITVTDTHPLLIYHLNVSLEWDARNDQDFLRNLDESFKEASAILYDVTDGQVALGQINLFHNKGYWGQADVLIHADNSLRPSAYIGGVANRPYDDPGSDTMPVRENVYGPGQIHMGTIWNPYGDPTTVELGENWTHALAHEIAHYVFFVPDNYLGLTEDNILTRIVCPGSFLTSTSDPEFSEFVLPEEWANDATCQRSLANITTGRGDWETVKAFYPMLNIPENRLDGPSTLPLAITRVIGWAYLQDTPPLTARNYEIRNENEERLRLPDAQAYLFKQHDPADPTDNTLVALGSPLPGRDWVKVYGAEAGDTICLFDTDQTRTYSGCIDPAETIAIKPDRFPVWEASISAQAQTSSTVSVTVQLPVTQTLSLTETLWVQLYPHHYRTETGFAPLTAMDMSEDGRTYTTQLTFPLPAFDVTAHIWVSDTNDVRGSNGREALSTFRLSWPDFEFDSDAPINDCASDAPTEPPPEAERLAFAPIDGSDYEELIFVNNAPVGGPCNVPVGGPSNSGIGGPSNSGIGGPSNSGIGGPSNSGIGGPSNSGIGGPSNSGIGGGDFNAPILSADAQVVIYNVEGFFAPNGIKTLQALPRVPELTSHPWLIPVGEAYHVKLENTLLERFISFTYLEREVPEADNAELVVYFLPENCPENQPNCRPEWQRLEDTQRFNENLIVAKLKPEDGTYVIMATIQGPELRPGWNQFSIDFPDRRYIDRQTLLNERCLDRALASINGQYDGLTIASVSNIQFPAPATPSIKVNVLEPDFIYWIHIPEDQTVIPYYAPRRQLPDGSYPNCAANGLPAFIYLPLMNGR